MKRLLGFLFLFGVCSGAPLQVHMLSGSAEYQSEKSLVSWAYHLKKQYEIEATFSLGTDKATQVAGLENLETADVLVVFCRRWELSGDQAEAIQKFIKSKKPVIGIRTASHAFQFYLEFDHEILGGDYNGHGKGGMPVEILLNEQYSNHPVAKGVRSWSRLGKTYWNPKIAKDAQVLFSTEADGGGTPLAWTRSLSGDQRIFYTSLGLPADFENAAFIGLLDNALFWVSGEDLAK